MDHTNKYLGQDLADTECSTFAGLRNPAASARRTASPKAVMISAKREVETSDPAAAALTDEQICEQSPYWLADWNLSGMH